jgi:peptidoglycan-associated lipoprotein
MDKPTYFLRSVCLVCVALWGVSCKPRYPRCEQDVQCQQQGEVCVQGQCQECRTQEQCNAKYPNDPRTCDSGRCISTAECHTSEECVRSKGEGYQCRNFTCEPGCSVSSDCASGQRCIQHTCTVQQCEFDIDCGPQMACLDGICTAPPHIDATRVSAACKSLNPSSDLVIASPSVSFEFDASDLKEETLEDLKTFASCLKEVPTLRIQIEGHCDDRGTQEYNMALGDRRARSVQSYLERLGIPSGRMGVRSKGENEPLCEESTEACWARNRRVEFLQLVH